MLVLKLKYSSEFSSPKHPTEICYLDIFRGSNLSAISYFSTFTSGAVMLCYWKIPQTVFVKNRNPHHFWPAIFVPSLPLCSLKGKFCGGKKSDANKLVGTSEFAPNQGLGEMPNETLLLPGKPMFYPWADLHWGAAAGRNVFSTWTSFSTRQSKTC